VIIVFEPDPLTAWTVPGHMPTFEQSPHQIAGVINQNA